MKMNSDNHHNSVFSSPLPILLVLLVIALVFAGTINAGENSTDANDESVTELQAQAEEKNVEKEIDELVEGLGRAVEGTMEVVSDLFVTAFDEMADLDVCVTGSSEDIPRTETCRKERLTTLEELESGQEK